MDKVASMIAEVFEPPSDDVAVKPDSASKAAVELEPPMFDIPLSSVYGTALAAIKLHKHESEYGTAPDSLLARVLYFLGCEGGVAK
eukprot:1241024-Prymnesium_polylepis.1